MPFDDLELAFGAPNDRANAVSHDAIVAADSNNSLVAAAEGILDAWGFFSEFVPVSRGGRWRSTEELVRRLLPIFRRDPALGLGHGVTSLMAANLAWTSGDESACARVAGRLLAGERIAVAVTEIDHGNDLARNGFKARLTAGGTRWEFRGGKELISNLDRAPSVVLLGRTDSRSDARALTLLDWRKAATDPVVTTVRVPTSGMRGVLLGAADLTGIDIPADHTIGERGEGMEIVLKAFQLTRIILPTLATGTVDAALRLAIDFMSTRRLYGGDLWDLPHARYLVARAWGSLLLADSLARTAVRTLHIEPDQCFLLSAATKYLVPLLLNEAMVDLTSLLGSSFYTLDSPYAVLEKWMRDLIVLPIGHAGTAACLLTIVPNLLTWGRRARQPAPLNPRMFSLDPLEDEVDFSRLRVGAGSRDSVVAPLTDPSVTAAFRSAFPDLEADLDTWIAHLRIVQEECALLEPAQLGADAGPEVTALAARLAHALAAGALVGRWHATRTNESSAFARSDAALRAAAARLSELIAEHGEGSDFVWRDDVVLAAADHVRDCVGAHRSLGVEELPIQWRSSVNEEAREART